jgi:capsid assembly protease
MMIRALPHILSRIFGPPLLIAPAQLDALLNGLHAALAHRGSLIETVAKLPDVMAFEEDVSEPRRERTFGYRLQNGVATVPVHGVLVRRAGQVQPDSTVLESYENVSRVLAAAQGDNRVQGILLDIDSPGGEAAGVFDLARMIRQVQQTKPVWAMANDEAMSAAYVLASAAGRVWATETAPLGSIGVVALHADQSAADDAKGIKYTYLFRGARKVDGNPHQPLSEEAISAVQGEVDRIYGKLVNMVGEHRGIEPAKVRGQEAAVYFGENAKGAGLADEIGTIGQAHAALVQHINNPAQRGGTKMEKPAETTTDKPGTEKPADNVVQLQIDNAVLEARKAAQAQAGEIAALCQLAGQPEMAAAMIAEGITPAAATKRLQEKQAADGNRHQMSVIDTTSKSRAGGTGASVVTGADLEKAAQARFRAQRGR